ncbi:MAG: 6-phosphogluconolactonase [Pirellulales bacterium]|nr:6-phosphogluconolactonase [Pirellulales bacterium]
MEREYLDKDGKPLSKEDVYLMPPDELSDRSGIPLNICPDTDSLYEAIAEAMVQTLIEKAGTKTTMILPVGPIGQYPLFARKVTERAVDCRNLWTFNMDEFLDRNGRTLPESHPMSFKAVMMEHFFQLLPVELRMPPKQMHFPRHDNMDAIDRAFDDHAPDGVDFCLAGVGPEGHFAFNEDPNFRHVEVSEEEFLADRTRLVLVNTSTVDMDALVASCGDRSAIPPFAVTIGPHDILRARRTHVAFFAGRFQRCALRETLFRKPTMHFPGSLLKLRIHPDGSLIRQDITIWATPEEAGPVTTQTIG